ncbi:MAG: hypothetical protein OXI71_05385 [Gemmatimonadota bacterium]|nr:hypothetical protein [Gemmatimonadota bacterium]
MSRLRRARRAVFALAAVLAALSAVAWRQSTTRETMEELDRNDGELAVVLDEREDVAHELMAVESWGWVAGEAARRLGMRPPTEREVIITSGGAR